MYKIKMTSFKINAWMTEEIFNIFVDDNLLSVFEKEDTKVVFYNGFIIGCINTR